MHTKGGEKLALWRHKVEEYRKSGLSRRAFCEREGIKKSSLDYWLGRIRKEEAEPGFVEVKVSAAPIPNTLLEVLVAGKYGILIHSGFDRELLADVVRTLERLA